jgi:hypothetical protein
MKSSPVSGCSSETYSHPDMNKPLVISDEIFNKYFHLPVVKTSYLMNVQCVTTVGFQMNYSKMSVFMTQLKFMFVLLFCIGFTTREKQYTRRKMMFILFWQSVGNIDSIC